MIAQHTLSAQARELHLHLLAVPGCDIWSYDDARAGRELEAAGYARIVRARERIAGHLRQPYFGIKLTAKGRKVAKTEGWS